MASPAVVKIVVKGDDGREVGRGSGFIVAVEKTEYNMSSDPYDSLRRPLYLSTLVTNYHVIRPAVSVYIVFHGEAWNEYDAFLSYTTKHGWVSEVAAEDERADIAVLMVRSRIEPTRTLKLDEGPLPPVGAKVYAIGNPLGLGNTLSEGLVSAHRKRGRHAPWIQITAPISPGSSGGPLLSADGNVLGITTATIKDGQNLNFAIPAKEVLSLLNAPPKSRPIWQEAGIRATHDDALGKATVTFYENCREAFRQDHAEPNSWNDEDAKCLQRKLRDGDQLALINKAEKLYFDNSVKEWIATLRRATEAKPGEFAYLAYFNLAKAIHWDLMRSGIDSFERMIDPLSKAKNLKPDFAPTIYWLAWTYDSSPDRYLELLLEADALVRLMPRCYEAYQFRGTAWAELGRAEAFERDFETAYELRPNDPILIARKADGFTILGEWRKAIETYKQVLALNETCSILHILHLSIAEAYEKLADYAEAIKSYQAFLKAVLKYGAYGDTSVQDVQQRIAECRRRLLRSP